MKINILDDSRTPFILTDNEGIIAYHNRGLNQLLGYEQPVHSFGKLGEIFMNNTVSFLLECIRMQKFNNLMAEGEVVLKGGRKKKVCITTSEVRHDGKSLLLIQLFHGATQISGGTGKLSFSRISDEVRTPLHTISATAEILARTNLNQQQQEYIRLIGQSAGSLMDIMNNVLDLSSMERGHIVMDSTGFRLGSVTGKLQEQVRNRYQGRRAGLAIDTDPELLKETLMGDASRLREVLWNIFERILEVGGDEEMKLSIMPQDRKGDEITVGFCFHHPGNEWDPPAESMMASFFLEKQQESKLGQMITTQLIQSMKGEITIKQLDKQGFELVLSIPFRGGDKWVTPGEHEPAPKELLMQELGEVTALIAEDQEFNRMVIEAQLNSMGINTLTASNGREAIELLKDKKPDLILMDIQMPVMDGIKATREIRKESDEKIRDIPIIAVTAYGMKEHKNTFLSEGMDGFLAKPFTSEDLINEILRVLDIELPGSGMLKKEETEPQKGYDLSSILQMAQGNFAFVESTINTFINKSAESLDTIRQTYDTDPEETLRLIHKIKPSFLYIGLKDTYDTILEIEKELKEQKNIDTNRNKLFGIIDSMPGIYRQLRTDLIRLKGRMD